ncbi:MAG: PEP-CTERM sorting domain-containing protein, partial [Phycisphaerae bacterium]|nr:PEP-CTERM sorting domain-containing protein [Phycisphaerae bacterium]
HAMNRILATVAMAATLIFAAVGSTSAALILPTPDGDTFSTAGTPPTGWVKYFGSDWSASSGVLNAGAGDGGVWPSVLLRQAADHDDYYVYDSTKTLAISVDINPNLGSSTTKWAGFEVLSPILAGGWLRTRFDTTNADAIYAGYFVKLINGQIALYRRDSTAAAVLEGSASLSGVTNWDTTFNTYKVQITKGAGTAATIDVFVNNVLKISFADATFLPYANLGDSIGNYTHYQNALGTGPATSGAQFDNYQVSALTAPEPATMAFLAIGGLTIVGTAIRRRRQA